MIEFKHKLFGIFLEIQIVSIIRFLKEIKLISQILNTPLKM